MSVSDPAPLPRLGEVFFDVRGNSRSMRLSWYADTGVAVFSIWQAGMCTGTFRLPIADLSRMIEILERGPAPRGRGRAPVTAAPHADDRGSDSDWYYGAGEDEPARSAGAANAAGYGGEYPGEYGQPGYPADYGRSERRAAEYGGGQYGHSGPADHREADFGAGYGAPGGYGSVDYGGATGEHYQSGGYDSAGQTSGDDHRTQGYPADYGRAEHPEGGGYRQTYESGGHGPGGYGAADADYRTGEYASYPDERREGSDRGYRSDYDDRREFRPGVEQDSSGYRDERFVAPYVGDGGQSYPNDNAAPGGGYHEDAHDPGYPADRRPVSPSDRYPDPSAPEEAYSYGAEYRYR